MYTVNYTETKIDNKGFKSFVNKHQDSMSKSSAHKAINALFDSEHNITYIGVKITK